MQLLKQASVIKKFTTSKRLNLIKISKFSYFLPRIYNEKLLSNKYLERKFSRRNTCYKSNIEDVDKFFKRETEDYFIHQFETNCLSQYSYYIESGGEVAIIDPIRDSEIYIKLLNERGTKLKYILETHFHADFVSGHLELANLTGAKIIFGPDTHSNLEVYVAKDSELLSLGNINLKVFHTPGHTLESTSYVLLDRNNNPKVIFTGDFLFLGEVGRPDLAVGNGLTEVELAKMLFNSIKRLKNEYPEDLVIFPGHGAGSACGKNISKGGADTLRNQLKVNYALNDNLLENEFVEIVTTNLPTPPQYFFYDVMLNKKGYEMIKNILNKSLIPFSPKKFVELLKSDPNIKVIDNREFSKSRNLFLKGSYLISLDMQYAIWIASLLKPDDKILLITDKEKLKESIIRLSRVGFDNVIGYLDGDISDIKNYLNKEELDEVNILSITEIKNFIEENEKNKIYQIIDVREPNEWKLTGIVSGSLLYNLKNLEENIDEIKKINRPIGLYCKTGQRATVASSILMRHGIKNIIIIGGIDDIIKQNVNLTDLKN